MVSFIPNFLDQSQLKLMCLIVHDCTLIELHVRSPGVAGEWCGNGMELIWWYCTN
jgi:hypothetical protein